MLSVHALQRCAGGQGHGELRCHLPPNSWAILLLRRSRAGQIASRYLGIACRYPRG